MISEYSKLLRFDVCFREAPEDFVVIEFFLGNTVENLSIPVFLYALCKPCIRMVFADLIALC